MHSITPLRHGWTASAGDAFYPADLPEDWRLDYFAGAVSAVLAPVEAWAGDGQSRSDAWVSAIPARLRLYLEDHPHAMTRGRWRRLSGQLGERLAGLVSGLEGGPASRAWCDRLFVRGIDGSLGTAHGAAYRVPEHCVQDLRAARGWVTEIAATLGERPCVLLLGEVDIGLAEDWETLIDLLGYARG